MGKHRIKKIGFFPGNWDLLHPGHVRALKFAKRHCDVLYVGVKENNRDRPEKNEPIMSVGERIEILKSIYWVDYLIPYKNERGLHALDAKNYFNIRFMGEDHRWERHHPINAKIIYVPREHNYSTTNLRHKIWRAENRKH